MYDFIEGKLIHATPTQAVIASGGIGYCITIPVSTFDALPKEDPVRLYTHLHVREDVLRLYGFATEDERRIFTSLIGVQGIGPGMALAVLNGISVEAFRRAVVDEDLAALSRAKGVGRKTAQRMVVELKREMERQLVELPAGTGRTVSIAGDAIAAMLALGYRRSQAETAVAAARRALGSDASLEQAIRETLRRI